ncbi:MAG: 5'-nucleotidase C-terminal domain-containing protein [Lachnospiraceae bacterium]|nr:5'-nucleotidase C-terminal domain-containing protein [Lachnospiraceae bacterium]
MTKRSKKQLKRVVAAMLTAFMLTASLSGCGSGDENKETDEKIQIKVQYMCGRMNLDLESVLENKFPDVDIVTDELVGDPDYIIAKEMEHNIEPDIYLYEGLCQMDDKVIADKFYDLSQEEFTNNFYLSAVSECVNEDGGLYYLPGPVYVYGIVYDKTAFQELDLKVPHSYTEFVNLLNEVKAMNLKGTEPDENDPDAKVTVDIEPFVPTVKWADMWTFIFDSYIYDDYLKGVDNALWLDKYQQGNESMIGHMEGAAEKLIKLFSDGILSPAVWEMRVPVRTAKLYRYHTSLMTIECQSAQGFNERENSETPDNLHEIGMMPFYTSDREGSDYLISMPRCYFGMTRKAAQDEAKKDAILEIFNFLSTQEGQDLMIEGGGGEINLLKDTNLTDEPFYDEVRDTFSQGRIISRFNFAGKSGAVESYMHSTTLDLVDGKISVEDWLTGADHIRDEALENKPVEEESYGTVKEMLTMEETAVVVGEAYIHATGADIGIVPCRASFGMKNRLFEGPITDKAIDTISTTRMSAGIVAEDPNQINIVTVKITGQQLLDLLEKNRDTFVGLAGLDVEYDPSKPEDERYLSIMYKGKEIAPDDEFTAASVRGAVKSLPVVKTYNELVFSDMFINYLNSRGKEISGAPESLKIMK